MIKEHSYPKLILILIILIPIFTIHYAYASVEDTSKIYENLRENLNNLLSNNNLKGTKFSIYIYSISRNELIYAKDENLVLTPASCTKLVTTFALFNLFQGSKSIETKIYSDDKINSEGILEGNLYIAGRGDGLFNSSDLDVIVESIKKTGIKQIKGNIYADVSYFDSIYDRFIYSGDLDRVEDLQPITPLSIERNFATIIVSAGNNPSKSVNVQIIPKSPYFTKSVNLKINRIKQNIPKKPKSRRKTHKYFNIDSNFELTSSEFIAQEYGDKFWYSKTTSKSTVGISISSPKTNKLTQNFHIHGSLNPNSTYTYKYQIHNPPLAISGALKLRLESAGIIVNGTYGVIDTMIKYSSGKNIISTIIRDIDEIITLVNKNSDNFLAEILFKIIGSEFDKQIHNRNETKSELSKKAMLKILQNNGIKCENCAFNDGSGLSRRNRISSKDLVDLLIKVYYSEYFERFYSSLAVAGTDGTLIKRMKSTKAENNLHGKTGTLRNVSSLAGYVYTSDGELISFSLIFNGGNVNFYKKIENQIGILLSEFSSMNDYRTE